MSRIAALVLLFTFCTIAAAQPASQSDLLAVDSAFVDGRYEQVELMTLRILQGDAELTPDETARLNLTAGYALIMLGRESEARSYFNHALDAVPDLTLDPVQVSPKFRVVFDEVKAARPAAVGSTDQESASDQSVQQNTFDRTTQQAVHVTPQSQVMNLIIPGSGQWREGHPVRGVLVFGLQAAALGVLIWQLNELDDSRGDYLAETDPARISAAYNNYNDHYQAAWGAGVAAGLVYLAAQADLAFLTPAHARPAALQVVPTPSGMGLCLRW